MVFLSSLKYLAAIRQTKGIEPTPIMTETPFIPKLFFNQITKRFRLLNFFFGVFVDLNSAIQAKMALPT